jgi:hypothetical protein
MDSNTARIVTVISIAFTLSACAADDYLGKPKDVDPNIFPTEFKKQITDLMTTTLEDPTNVKDAFISDPALMPVGRDQRYAVCVRSNSRNAARQYKGSVDHIAYFYAGQLNQMVEAKDQCAKAAYKPYPELEKLCLARKCD